ncbi:unnamed protein product, partial [Allacma fusca]
RIGIHYGSKLLLNVSLVPVQNFLKLNSPMVKAHAGALVMIPQY